VSIGGTLADARHQAGLTVAEVSAYTRIREALIRAIEQDEFRSCGGDFYARGHIRAIAAVVGTDPQPLISEYDAEHPAGRPPALADLPGEPPPRPPLGPRHGKSSWLGPVVLLAIIAVIVFVAYRLTPGTGAASSQRPGAVSHSARPGPRTASPSRPASPSATPTATPVTELTPVSAVAFGPDGTSDGDNPQGASQALSGDPDTPWHTSWYTTARFGNLQAGTGLLVDLGRVVTATSVTIALGNTPGADLQVRAGASASDLRSVATRSDVGGTVRMRLASHPRARYLLIWFTLLPPDSAGTYQAYISRVTVTAYAG